MQDSPKVSVCMITFNHEKYIREAIDGVLVQQTNFQIELILANDCSSDGTDAIIQNILETHPRAGQIRYFKHEKNLGMMPNFMFAFEQCHGKYIALCEGDDYWTDPLKLQKQVDFLEANPEYALCFHEVQIKEEAAGTLIEDNITRKVPDTTDIRDLARGNYIHTPSVVFRNGFSLPNWFSECVMGDWPLYCIITGDKKIKKLTDVMAVYRRHPSSMWSAKDKNTRILNTLHTYRLVLESGVLNPEAKTILQTSMQGLKNQLPKKSSFLQRLKNLLTS
ncbi:MAG: glycosyltransferase [Flavobacteriaceae bacterium]|nr:glycosyltransferase [Flavobacteriaceae bacterium]